MPPLSRRNVAPLCLGCVATAFSLRLLEWQAATWQCSSRSGCNKEPVSPSTKSVVGPTFMVPLNILLSHHLRTNGIMTTLFLWVISALECCHSNLFTFFFLEIKVGLRQGCVMSPWLFNIDMDGVIRNMKGKVGEVLVRMFNEGMKWVLNDDTVLITKNE